jgi:hypothetical protein
MRIGGFFLFVRQLRCFVRTSRSGSPVGAAFLLCGTNHLHHAFSVRLDTQEEVYMGRAALLWLLGIPIPIIFIIWLLGGLHG